MFECVRRSYRVMDKIKISRAFSDVSPKPEKLIQKTADFVSGKEISPIIIDRDMWLIDGYCSYLISKTLNKKVKIVQVREVKKNV